ncbi:MAG: FkbM family methyltransferase [Candidatus Binatia bacterium]
MRNRTYVVVPLMLTITAVAVLSPQGPLQNVAIRTFIWATGNGGGCTFAQCVNEIGNGLLEKAESIKAKSTLMTTTRDLELWDTPSGQFWNPKGNALFFDLAEQSFDVYQSKQGGIRHGDIVLDCGANVGTFTRTALMQGASLVVAFDIDPRNIKSLNATFFKEIAAGTVIVVPEGVWHQDDTLEAKFYSNTNLNTITMATRTETDEKPEMVRVPLTKIDTVVERLGLPRVDYIKMDVEGAEAAALRGARATITRFHPRMSIAVENEPGDIDTIPALVRSFGISYSETPGAWRRIRPWVIRPEAITFVPR